MGPTRGKKELEILEAEATIDCIQLIKRMERLREIEQKERLYRRDFVSLERKRHSISQEEAQGSYRQLAMPTQADPPDSSRPRPLGPERSQRRRLVGVRSIDDVKDGIKGAR